MLKITWGVMGYTRSLSFYILMAILLGALLGFYDPTAATAMKPFADAFIKALKMIIGPIIFLSLTIGMAKAGDIKRVGRVGIKAILYFEVVSTIALLFGLAIALIVKPGLHAALPDIESQRAIASYIDKGHHLSMVEFLVNIIPTSFLSAFSEGNMLQIVFISLLFGLALILIGHQKSKPIVQLFETVNDIFFIIVRLLLYTAPLGAFGGMAYTVGTFGVHILGNLAMLVGLFYFTSVLFIGLCLGAISWCCGISLLSYIKWNLPELLMVFGASSSEPAMPSLMKKLTLLGISKETVGLVVPAGYSFNLDGTNIYMALASLFIAQAYGVELSWQQIALLIPIIMITSKGATGISGSGFITLAATLAVIPQIPAVGLALIFGIDRFMSECRALTNHIGNGIAAIAIARWDKEISAESLHINLEAHKDNLINDSLVDKHVTI
ncbi:MAG: cation:dicarboxylase symporter family transporter [Alphaproteobacteria bacterium]|nr:cation:dicarboxylase symporter family transporter [Alphaproteobacteria bacterium]